MPLELWPKPQSEKCRQTNILKRKNLIPHLLWSTRFSRKRTELRWIWQFHRDNYYYYYAQVLRFIFSKHCLNSFLHNSIFIGTHCPIHQPESEWSSVCYWVEEGVLGWWVTRFMGFSPWVVELRIRTHNNIMKEMEVDTMIRPRIFIEMNWQLSRKLVPQTSDCNWIGWVPTTPQLIGNWYELDRSVGGCVTYYWFDEWAKFRLVIRSTERRESISSGSATDVLLNSDRVLGNQLAMNCSKYFTIHLRSCADKAKLTRFGQYKRVVIYLLYFSLQCL